MVAKSFHLNTEPHVATVGTVDLLFEAEVIGAEFASAYAALREVQAKLPERSAKATSTKHAKKDGELPEPAVLAEISEAMREFIGRFLLPASREDFAGLRLPDRVLVELMEWVAELYGGGSGNRDADGGTSSG